MAERINSFNPRSILEHEEMAHVIRTGTTNGTHQTIPHQLQHFLDNMKKQYLSFIDTMQVIVPCVVMSVRRTMYNMCIHLFLFWLRILRSLLESRPI